MMLNNNCIIINIEESDDNAKETKEDTVSKKRKFALIWKKIREIILQNDLSMNKQKMLISRNWEG